MRQSTPYLGSFHFLLKEVAEVCTKSTSPLTNYFILFAISLGIFLPTAEEEGWASPCCCKHLLQARLLWFSVRVKLRLPQTSPSNSGPSHRAPTASVAPGYGLCDTKQHQNFLIFFFLGNKVHTFRKLTWTTCCSSQKSMVSLTKVMICDTEVTSFLIK